MGSADLLQRVVFQQFLGGEEHDAPRIGVADGFDLGGLDGIALVAEAVADKGEHGGHFIVLEHPGKGSHRDLAIVFFAVDLQGAHEAVHGEFDEAGGIAADPGALLQ